MTTNDQFFLAFQAYQELQQELQREERPQPKLSAQAGTAAPEKDTSTLPSGSLLLGIAEDGLPVLLDLYDPAAGPLLVAGDRDSGKTAFLHSLAFTSNIQDPGDISFGVLTPFPEEWTSLESLPNCLGIWPAYHPSAQDFLSKLVRWADGLPGTKQAILLLYDGFDLMNENGDEPHRDLRWLLKNGPQKQVWPVISINPARLIRLRLWLEHFHTRILGQVSQAHNARMLVDDSFASLGELIPGKQFGLAQAGGWLKFSLPSLEQGL